MRRARTSARSIRPPHLRCSRGCLLFRVLHSIPIAAIHTIHHHIASLTNIAPVMRSYTAVAKWNCSQSFLPYFLAHASKYYHPNVLMHGNICSYVNVVDVVEIAALTINNTATIIVHSPEVKLSHSQTMAGAQFKNSNNLKLMRCGRCRRAATKRQLHFAKRLLQYVIIIIK